MVIHPRLIRSVRVQVKLFTELFGNLFNSVIFTVLRADTREGLTEAHKQFDKNLKVSSCKNTHMQTPPPPSSFLGNIVIALLIRDREASGLSNLDVSTYPG